MIERMENLISLALHCFSELRFVTSSLGGANEILTSFATPLISDNTF